MPVAATRKLVCEVIMIGYKQSEGKTDSMSDLKASGASTVGAEQAENSNAGTHPNSRDISSERSRDDRLRSALYQNVSFNPN